MKKKVLSALLVASMTATMFAGCGEKKEETTTPAGNDTQAEAPAGDDAAAEEETVDYGSGDVKIWASEESADLTKTLAEKFIADKGADYTVTVESVGEGDAASNMLTDVQAGADIYAFAQDQTARLVAANALQPWNETGYDEWIKSSNDAGAVSAATVGDNIYAFPLTSDNGYFLYYDKSVVTDPSSLEKIVEDCEAAGKNFYCEINSGWYQTAFFFGTGCTLTYDTDNDGNFTKCNIDYASDKGVVALKEIAELQSSKSFQNGSSVDKTTNCAAIVDGTWDSSAAKDMFGDNYACAPLPSFTGSDGNTYELGGFGGFKLMGVKPQTEAGKMKLCADLAQYLTDTEAQLERFNALGWGPSNLTAQQDGAVTSNEALTALGTQLAKDVTIPQGQYPNDYWSLATSLGDDVISGKITKDTSDDDLMKILQTFSETCESYAK